MLRVLIVDDQPDDVFLTQRALSRCDPSPHTHVVSTGKAAIDYLMAAQTADDLPDLVLLDLNLLGEMDGFDVLEFIRSQPVIQRTITVVLSSSESALDVHRAYDQLANAYVVKPSRMKGWVGAMQSLVDMLDRHASLPHRRP